MNTENENNFYVKLAEVFLEPILGMERLGECEKWLMGSFNLSFDFARGVSTQAHNNLMRQIEENVNNTLDRWKQDSEAKADTNKGEMPLGVTDLIYLMDISGRVEGKLSSVLLPDDLAFYYRHLHWNREELYARGYLTLHNNKDALTDRASEALNVFESGGESADVRKQEVWELTTLIVNYRKNATKIGNYFSDKRRGSVCGVGK